ncbi:MAG: hypothetical protein ACKO4Q_04025, partial [Planctomycetota bacterium]
MKQLAALCLCAVAVPFAIAQQDSKSPAQLDTQSEHQLESKLVELSAIAVSAQAADSAEIDNGSVKDEGLAGGFASLTGCTGNVVVRCPATVNSTGFAATLQATGTPSVSQPGFALSVASAPADRPVQFLYSSSAVQLPFGDGWLCVSPYSGVRRLSSVLLTDSNGSLSLSPSFGGTP